MSFRCYPFCSKKKVSLDGLNKEEIQLLIKVAKATESLLNNTHLQKTDNTLRNKYLELLKQTGYASVNGFIKRTGYTRVLRQNSPTASWSFTVTCVV